jgi:hypothetical protein
VQSGAESAQIQAAAGQAAPLRPLPRAIFSPPRSSKGRDGRASARARALSFCLSLLLCLCLSLCLSLSRCLSICAQPGGIVTIVNGRGEAASRPRGKLLELNRFGACSFNKIQSIELNQCAAAKLDRQTSAKFDKSLPEVRFCLQFTDSRHASIGQHLIEDATCLCLRSICKEKQV